ncbi:LCP family protein [Candidatus Dojkabacteria bacterium]|nr:LCP family protein [Candidatus Dojkabacteria bacterium]
MKKIQIDMKKDSPKDLSQKLPRFGFFHRRNRSTKSKMKPMDLSSSKNSRKKTIKWIILALVTIILGVGGYYGYRTYSALRKSGIDPNPAGTIKNFITNEDPELKKGPNNMTSVLLIGIDTRPTQQGLQNTDTIMIITLNHNTDEVTMLSIPRDTWVAHPNYPSYHSRINAIYSLCENEEKGTGLACLVDVVQSVTNIDMQYYGMIDIAGFVEIIDLMGGVDVEVENAFTDYMFPNPQDSGYITVSFDEGMQHMDGDTAMKFARSRHAQSTEGSDFARARRQQKIIMATKEKALSSETLTDPGKILEIIEELSDSIKVSDIKLDDIHAALIAAKKVDEDSMYSMVLDPMAGNWTLLGEDPSAAYVLYPKAGIDNWSEVHKFVDSYIKNPALYSEKATIYVFNGGIGYYPAQTKYTELVQKYPYLNIKFGGNKPVQTYTGTSIVSFSDKKKIATLEALEEFFGTETLENVPQGTTNPYAEDIEIILGQPETQPAAQ